MVGNGKEVKGRKEKERCLKIVQLCVDLAFNTWQGVHMQVYSIENVDW
jgi:hypothetical protein